ncbi:MAG: FliM/FliN family flagellar motor switch protein [Legionella sp.]|nr:FliM/FliN family flagellar motor switch protein [Legionella sp.]
MSVEEPGNIESQVDTNAEATGSNKEVDLLFDANNMDILNDVDMQITVEIGRAKMKLSDLLNLKRGSVIELAQAADDPLQILANDKPIAKGVIISLNGKYGVKIV